MIKNTDLNSEKNARNHAINILTGFKYCLSLLLIFAMIAGCADPSRVYEQNIDLPGNLWLADSVAEFQFEIKDATARYNLYYNVRNSLSYPYHNLYVRHTLEDSLGNMLGGALQNMDLFDPVTGKPLGEGLGDIFDHQILAIPDQKFPENGWYRFKMQQFMRQDSLPLILSIGLRVELAELDEE